MAKYFIRKAATVMVALFISGVAGASIDRHDKVLTEAAIDLMQIEAQERKRFEDWHEQALKIELDRLHYEEALQAAMEARNASGDYGEVYEYE